MRKLVAFVTARPKEAAIAIAALGGLAIVQGLIILARGA